MRMQRLFGQFLVCVAVTFLVAGCSPSPPAPVTQDDTTSPDAAADPSEEETTPSSEQAAPTETPGEEPDEEAPPETEKAPSPPAQARVITGDWPMWCGSPNRNLVSAMTGLSIDFQAPIDRGLDKQEAQNVLWIAKLGSQTYGNPIVAEGKVFVGANNGGDYRPKYKGRDKGCILCFDEKTGKFLWQLTRDKLSQGKVNDWPEQGICSAPCVEDGRMWVVTNRAEVMCVDVEGFYDDENDGPYEEEVDVEKEDADIIWNLDMIEELGVFPHNLATSSPVIYGDNVFVVTANGVAEDHLEIPSPRSPSFLAVNKNTGEVVWEDNAPFDSILHGQWSSPTIGVVNGQAQVYMPGGDGWLYAYDAEKGELIWKFDLNPKDSQWELGGRGTRNAIIATPVFYENSVVLAVGQDPEHGESVGHLYRIAVDKKGDVSPVLPDGKPNPNSAQIWHLGGIDEDGSITGEKGAELFRRTMSTVAIHNGLVYAPDLSGRLHCVDFATGKRFWEYDVLAGVWGSPMVVDGKVMLGDEDGDLAILAAGKEENELDVKIFPSSIYSTPTIANGVLYISDRSRLYAFSTQ